MKKFFIPALLLLSMTGLVACGGSDNGVYVKNGVAYKNDDAKNIDANIKAAKENKVKTVVERTYMDMTIKATANGESATMITKMDGSIVFDLENGMMEGDISVNVDYAGIKANEKATFTAKEDNGSVYYLSYNDLARDSYDTDDLTRMYEEATTSIYSWNYSPETANIDDLISQTGQASANPAETLAAYKKITNALVYSGDFTTGTFDIGLGKSVTTKLAGTNITFNKFVTSFKDGMLDSSLFGFKFVMSSNGAKVSAEVTAGTTFTYAFVD